MGQKVKKPNITITELLSVNKTADCRKMLKRHGIDDAKNYEDLQDKLIKLYQTTPDKKQFEKEVAGMHPHKDFILKYCAPSVAVPSDIKVGPGEPISKDGGTTKITVDDYSVNEGMRSENKLPYSCACGCGAHSNFSGDGRGQSISKDIQLLALVSMVAIVALIIHSKK